MIQSSRSPLLLSAFLLAACNGDKGSDQNITQLTPVMAVFPEALEFGEVAVQYSEDMTLEIQNVGRAPLEIDSIALAGVSDSSYTIAGIEGTQVGESSYE